MKPLRNRVFKLKNAFSRSTSGPTVVSSVFIIRVDSGVTARLQELKIVAIANRIQNAKHESH